MKKKLPKRTTKAKSRAGKHKSVSPKSELASSVALVDQLAATQPETYLKPAKPADNPGVLWVASANGRVLTSTGMLQLARARNAAGIAIDELKPFAENEIERALIQLIHTTRPNLFAGCNDPLKGLFLLRAIHIPTVCRGFLFNEESKKSESVVWLGALSAYSVAYERTLFERLFRAMGQAKFTSDRKEQYIKWATTKFGDTILNWFDDAKECSGFWLSRFDQWHEYAMRSLDHWMGCQSIDYRRTTGSMKEAAHLGILKCLEALPEDRFADLLDAVNAAGPTQKMFQKNAKKRATTPSNIEFESWLIECWPLVLEYGWNYRELQLVANRRFEVEHVTSNLTAESIKERCEKLGLTLGNGSKKIGRVRASEESVLPRMFQLALKIDALEDHKEWYWGHAGDSLNIFQDLSQQS